MSRTYERRVVQGGSLMRWEILVGKQVQQLGVQRSVLATVMFLFAGSLAFWWQTTQPVSATAGAGFNKFAYIVYFTPADRDPQPNYRKRLEWPVGR